MNIRAITLRDCRDILQAVYDNALMANLIFAISNLPLSRNQSDQAGITTIIRILGVITAISAVLIRWGLFSEPVVDPRIIEAANSALLDRIDALLYDQLGQGLLDDSEIASFKKLVAEYPDKDLQEKALALLESYEENTNCVISLETIIKPVTISAAYPSETETVRKWEKTYDADSLKTFITNCTKTGRKAFAPNSPSDHLDDKHVTFKAGYGDEAISIISHVREELSDGSKKNLNKVRENLNRYRSIFSREIQESLLPSKREQCDTNKTINNGLRRRIKNVLPTQVEHRATNITANSENSSSLMKKFN